MRSVLVSVLVSWLVSVPSRTDEQLLRVDLKCVMRVLTLTLVAIVKVLTKLCPFVDPGVMKLVR